MSTIYRLVAFGSLQALAILLFIILLFFNSTQVANADLAELVLNSSTKGLLLSPGTLSPELLLGDDQLGVDEPKCFPGAKKKADECFNKTMVDVTQTTDLKKQCALYYNEWVLCSIAAICKCDYTIAHDFESKVKENVTSVVKNCTDYFKNYPFMSKDYCNKTDITNSRPTTTTKNNQVMVTTDKSVTVPVQCPIDTTKAQEIDLKCSEMINKTFADQSGPEVTCRKVYTSLLCTIDTNCKCSYIKTHASEDKLKKDLKAAWKGQCEGYFKQYKYMSSYRCTETPENAPGLTTKRTSIWIIIGGTVGGVVGLVLLCCCIGVCCCGCVLCNRTDDKPTSGGGRILAGQASSTSPAIPSGNAGGGGSTSKIVAPSKSAAVSKVSALPSDAAKAVTKTRSRGKGKGKIQKKVSKKRSSSKVVSRSKLSNVGR